MPTDTAKSSAAGLEPLLVDAKALAKASEHFAGYGLAHAFRRQSCRLHFGQALALSAGQPKKSGAGWMRGCRT